MSTVYYVFVMFLSSCSLANKLSFNHSFQSMPCTVQLTGIVCPYIFINRQTHRDTDSNSPRVTVLYWCDLGFYFPHHAADAYVYITCNPDGRWSATDVICQRTYLDFNVTMTRTAQQRCDILLLYKLNSHRRRRRDETLKSSQNDVASAIRTALLTISSSREQCER